MIDRRTTVERVRQETHDWRCDDVVVDFPSMAGVIAGMRRSFFDAAGDGDGDGDDASGATHTAEVRLTRKEAGEGARVPIDLQVRQTCPMCGGRGEVWSESCGVCAGTGAGLLPHRLNLRVPAGVHDGARLRFRVNPPFAPETHVEVRIAIP